MIARIIFILLASLMIGCSRNRAPIPPGTIPQVPTVSATDEQYGHDVLSALTEQFELDTDDAKINRARDIVDRLAISSGNDQQPWHVHVLKDDSVKNAAATRGNYLFVWSGMFNTIRDDTELATIIAHEMGHVLANHTEESAEQEAAQILSGILGIAAGSTVAAQGYGGPLSDLAQMMVENIFQAALLNPQSQEDELEADHIGLFLMSDAGYDPKKALEFWKRVQSDPDFQTGTLEFFSSHPSTEARVIALSKYVDQAEARYQLALGKKPDQGSKVAGTPQGAQAFGSKNGRKQAQQAPPPPTTASITQADQKAILSSTSWMVAVPNADIYAEPNTNSALVGTVAEGTAVNGNLVQRRWLNISSPQAGYIRSSNLSPLK